MTRQGDRDAPRRGSPLPAACGLRRAGERAGRTSTTFRSRSSGSARDGSGSPGSSRSRRCSSGTLPYAKWYLGGKLNVSYNCLDRHVEAGLGDRVAYHYEGEPVGERATITYAQLLAEVVEGRERPARRSASARARRSASTWAWGPGSRSRCSPARASARRTRSCSAASRPRRSRTALNDMRCEVLHHAGRELAARDRRCRSSERGRGARLGAGRPDGRRRTADDAARCR